MKAEKKQNSNLMHGVVAIAAIFVIGLIYVQFTQQNQTADNYQVPAPKEVVSQYFTAWNSKDWPNMYATLSDGFKKIDPNAKDLATFRNFAGSQGIGSINILSIKETSNDGITASAEYSAEFVLSDGSRQKFGGTFTLKYRQGDIIPGWKLIHPYGPNIDTS
ncbi:MAG: hypothetical protein HY514_04690 [Candidatus Aenigmarchaeota archaeon]|nr:hypothetical protein [Candidatus Aenigmarchaeota archaeon]